MFIKKIILLCFLCLGLIPLTFSTQSTTTGGFNIVYTSNFSNTQILNPISFSNILYSIPHTNNIDLNDITYRVNHTQNLYQTKIQIYENKSDPSTKICESDFNSFNYNTCDFTYTEEMITYPPTYYAFVCNDQNDCSLSKPFIFILKDESEVITGGFKLTSDKHFSDTQISTPVSFSNILYTLTHVNNVTLKEVIYRTNHTQNLYQTKIQIYENKSDPSTKICESDFNSLNYNTCNSTYTEEMITYPPTYYAFVCNNQNDCSLSKPFTFRLKDEAEVITGGFKLTTITNFSNNKISKPVSFSNIIYSIPHANNINLNEITYRTNHTQNLYQTKIQIYENKSDPSTKICESDFNNLNYNTCNSTYTEEMITYPPTYYAFVCNNQNDCSLSKPFKFILKHQSEAITGGFKLTTQSFLNITGINVTQPYYVPPTPQNNHKTSYKEYITIKVHDGYNSLDSCRIEINNKNYTMNYDNTHCTYTYQINQSSSNQTIEFQTFYQIGSIEEPIEKRNLYIYPQRNSNKVLPAYGIGSLIITLVIIIGGFLV